MTLGDILILYLVFRAKQVICDFFLQTSWMATVKGQPFNMGGAKALGAHAAVHGVFTLGIALCYDPHLWWLGVLDFFVHASVDKIKAEIINFKHWTYRDGNYWWAFGLDQEAHNLTHLCYIIVIIRALGFMPG